jgi:UDP-glucose 4-epimerase
MTKFTVLVTGGAGYIGSHAVVELVAAGYQAVIVDDFSNSHPEVLNRLKTITGQTIGCVKGDVRDTALMRQLLREHQVQAVMHFAGFKAVGESVQKPLDYYNNNVWGATALLQAMQAEGVNTLVFSSSATVYGDPASVPIREDFPRSATNPYGRSKLMIEDILGDLAVSDPSWRIARLRYFNPVGAHESGLIGEDPQGIPNNLMPFISQVAVGKRTQLSVFGGDYATPDGTGVRDFIHVRDLAAGHVAALRKLQQGPGLLSVNLGTGSGYSVLQLKAAFESASGKTVPHVLMPRRPGDIAQCYADPSFAKQTIGWQATRGIEQMCADAWRWQSNNPNGYASAA